MGLSKLTNPTPTAAPKAAEPEADTGLSIMPETGMVTMADALNAALSTESNRASNHFAEVQLQGGPTGGQFCPASFLPQEVQDTLPSGKKPIQAVLLGYRLSVSAWPVSYVDAQKNKPADGEDAKAKPRPVYSATVSANDATSMPVVMKAARNYQFTKSAEKSKFDYATSKAGHIRLSVELLTYLPEVGQPVVISSPDSYGAVETTLKNLQRLMDAKTGALGQFPCLIRGVTVDKTSKSGYTWKEHSLDIANVAGTADGSAGWTSFQAWKTEAAKDAAIVQQVRDWITAQDQKVTGDIMAALKAAAAL